MVLPLTARSLSPIWACPDSQVVLGVGTDWKLSLRPKKKVFGSYYVLKNIGRVGRYFLNLFLFFLFFNLHDSLELDGFDKGLPCCNCLYMH